MKEKREKRKEKREKRRTSLKTNTKQNKNKSSTSKVPLSSPFESWTTLHSKDTRPMRSMEGKIINQNNTEDIIKASIDVARKLRCVELCLSDVLFELGKDVDDKDVADFKVVEVGEDVFSSLAVTSTTLVWSSKEASFNCCWWLVVVVVPLP